MVSKTSSKFSINQEIFSYSVDGKSIISKGVAQTAKSRPSNNIIESFFSVGTHSKQYIALNHALATPRLFKQAFDCAYCWKDNKIIHTTLEILNNQNEMINLAKVNSVKRGRITDNKNIFQTANVVIIVAST